MLVDAASGGIVSAIPILKNDKHTPHDLGMGVKLYADNTLLEASFPPSFTVATGVMRMRHVLRKIKEKLGDDFRLAAKAAHVFSGLPPKPDDELVLKWLNFCVYDPDDTPRKQSPFQNGLRTGSFHIHVGNKKFLDQTQDFLLTQQSKKDAIKLMDIFVGCSSVIFDRDETSNMRKALYGKAGEYRPTRYGIEYRVLGNYALRKPELVQLCYNLTAFAMDVLANGLAQDVFDSVDEALVINAINTSNVNDARDVLQDASLPWKLFTEVNKEHPAENLFKAWAIE